MVLFRFLMLLCWFCFVFFGRVLLVCFLVLGYFCENHWPLNKEKVPLLHSGGKGTSYFYLSSEST